jgi:hypothetical protein
LTDANDVPYFPFSFRLQENSVNEPKVPAKESTEIAESSDEVVLEWTERAETDDSRVGQMYCFKNCGVNKN